MDNMKNMVIIKEVPHDNVVSYHCNKNMDQKTVKFSGGKTYHYGYENVQRLENPIEIDLNNYSFTNDFDFTFDNVKRCLEFKSSDHAYLRFFYNDGTFKSYNASTLKIEHNALPLEKAKSLFDYYKQISMITGLKSDNGTNTLTSKYENNPCVNENTVLDKYLKKQQATHKKNTNDTVLFPFGCNLSQINAVKNALYNQVSIIEGPPGTGKTQTILNIIANLVVRGNTVAIVSNNNDATNNVYEKLQKYDFAYIAAELGSIKNKEIFINEKQIAYPQFANDILSTEEENLISEDINDLESSLIEMLERKNKVAMLKQELAALIVEQQYFEDYFKSVYEEKKIFKRTDKLLSSTVLSLWNDCQNSAGQDGGIGFWEKIKFLFKYNIAYALLNSA